MCYSRTQASLRSPGKPFLSLRRPLSNKPRRQCSAAPQMNEFVCFRCNKQCFLQPRCICVMSTRNNVPLISCLCHMCAFPRFLWNVYNAPKLHQRWYQLYELLPKTNLFCELSYNFQLESPSGSRGSSWSPSGEPPRPMTLWCDIGHVADCMHSPKISLYFSIPSHSPRFTPASGQSWPWSIMSSIGGVLHFKADCSPLSTTNPNGQIHPSLLPLKGHVDNLISNAGIVFLFTTQWVW